MRALTTTIDRFCQRHPRFGIPNLIIFVIIGNVICYLFAMMDQTGYFLYYLIFSPSLILQGQIWRLITFIFIPESFELLFLFFFLYFYYFIGSSLERQWGSGKFTIYYLCGIIFNILYGFIIWFITGTEIYIGVNYLNLSMFFAFATFYPDQRVLLFFFIPIKIKWIALLDAAYFIYAVIVNPFPFNLMPLVATLNYLIFCWNDLMFYLFPFKSRVRPRVIHFKQETKRAEKEAEKRPYRYKCAVCGKTDTDYPNLEFRYCSKCAGYHCFCQDHINNHVHFTQ